MAGKKRLDQGPMLLGGLDLDDIDDFLAPKKQGKMTPKGAIKDFATSAGKGFKKQMNPKSLLESFMRTALPDGYVRMMGLYDDTGRGIQSIVDGIEDTEAAALENLAEKFEDNLPKLKGKLPDAVYERVKSKIEERKDQYKFRRQMDQARNKTDNPVSNLDREGDSAVEELMGGLGEAQLDLTKANGEVDYSKLEYEVKKDGIRAKLDKHRFDAMNRHLGLIADASMRQSTFNDSITYQFQRKSLELQTRSYLALRSLVRLTGETHELHRDAYTAIVHNTGLPEHRKSTESERTKFNAKQAVLNPFRNAVSKTASDFATNFLPSVFNNIGSKGSGLVRGATEGGGMLGPLLARLMSDPANNLGTMAGTEGANYLLQNILMPQVAKRVRPRLQKESDRLTGGLDSKLAYGLDNMGSLAQQFANDSTKSTGITGYLQDAVKMFAPQFKLNDLVKNQTYQTIDQAASFNQMTQRSITEIIPGYLSRILHETRMIRTGDDSIDRESYDITRGQFVSDRQSRDNLSKRIIGRGARQSMGYAMTATMGNMDSDGALSPEAKQALEERLLRDAMEGRHFDPEQYVRGEGYAPGTDATVIAELGSFFKGKFKFDNSGKLAKEAGNYRKRQEFSTDFNMLRDSVKSPLNEIERVLKSGNHTALRDLGIIHTVEGEDRINYNQLREYYRDLGEEGVYTETPSPTSPLMQRLRRDIKDKSAKARDKIRRTKGEMGSKVGDLKASFTTEGGLDDYKQSFKTGYQQATDASSQLIKESSDIISAASQKVVIKADEIASGELFDVTTQRVITSIDDIKGQVIDKLGNTRITEMEAVRGLMTLDGRKLSLIPPSLKIPSNVLSMIHQQRMKLGNAMVAENGPLSRIKDLYLEGQADPIIKASGIRAGEYIDITSGEVLETIDDIGGSIAHVNRPDEVLITTEDAKTRLVDSEGKKFKSSKLLRGLGSMLRGSGSIAKQLFKVGKGVLKFTSYAIGKRLLTLDAYLPGSSTPVLTSAKLKRGEYYDANGRALKSFDDLRDGVFGADGNILVSPEDVAELVNRDGSKHTSAKRRGFLRRMVKKAVVGGAKAIAGKWWSGTKAYYKGMGNKFKKGLSLASDKADAYAERAITPETGLLNNILGVLDKRLPKEGPKKGSTEWQLAQMENGKKTKSNQGKKKDEKTPKGLSGLLAGLFGRGKGNDNEDDNEGGDTNIHLGGEGGGGDKDNKKRKPKKPRGKFGRMLDKVKGSRIGGGLARAGGGLGTVARGAMMMGGGSLITGAGAMLGGLGTIAATAGAGLLAALSSPVVLGALAVGGLALGARWLYKRNKSTKGDFRSLRLMQYGITGTSDKLKVLKLEAYLERFATKGPNPQLNVMAADPKELFDIIGIDPSVGAELQALAQWIDLRFKPVFHAYLAAMHGVTPADTLIDELDDKLPDESKFAFLDKVGQVPPEVYQNHVTPFDFGEKLKAAINPEDISIKLRDLKAKWKDKAKQEDTTKEADTKETEATPMSNAASSEAVPKEKSKATGIASALGSAALKVTPIGFGISKLLKSAKSGFLSKFTGGLKESVIKATPAVLGGIGLISAVSMLGSSKLNKLSTLQAVRLRAYGRLPLDLKSAQSLFDLEARLYRDISFDQHGQGTYNGNLDTLIGHAGNYFGVDVSDPSDTKGVVLTEWLIQRYIPVALAYFAAVKAKANSITPSRVESALKPEQQLDVARAMMAATFEYNGDRISIWGVDTFFDNGTSDLNSLKAAAAVEIATLEKEVEKAKLASPGTSISEQDAQSKSKFGATVDKILDGAKNLGSRLKEKMGDMLAGVKDSFGSAVNGVKDWLGINPSPQAPGQSAYSNTYQSGGTLEQSGSVFTGFAKGNGGVWDSIPLPKANKSRDAAMPTLLAVQHITGVDAELLATFASIESGFDYLVKASTSSATGWFQFINDTWDEQLRKHASKYGIPADNKERYLRKDPRINALMGAEFLKGNYRYLADRLGRSPTDTDLYCAHFMGAGGAAGFLKRDRNAIAAALYPKEAAANRSIYFKTTGQPRTVGEIYALFESKVAKHRRNSNTVDVGKTNIGEPDAQKVADMQAAAMAKDLDLTDVTPDEGGGEVREGSATPGNDTIQMVADRAAAPMRATDPSVIAGAQSTPTGGSTTVTSGQDDPARQQAIAANVQRAEQADRSAAQTVAQKQAVTQASINIAERQLETQTQMRDLLKTIANKLDQRNANQAQPTVASSRGNDMGNTKPAVPERKPGNNPLPISFQR